MFQLVGAVLVLAGFVAAQAGRLDPSARLYLGVNLVGSAILAVDALHGRAWGFLLLEGVWALVSAWGLAHRSWGRRAAASAPRRSASRVNSASAAGMAAIGRRSSPRTSARPRRRTSARRNGG
jgi:hypothetical protein